MVQSIITHNIHKRKEVGKARVSFRWRIDKENVYIQQRNIPPLKRMIMIHVIVWMNLEKSQETSHERTHMTPYNKCLRYENVDRKQIGGEGLRVEGKEET